MVLCCHGMNKQMRQMTVADALAIASSERRRAVAGARGVRPVCFQRTPALLVGTSGLWLESAGPRLSEGQAARLSVRSVDNARLTKPSSCWYLSSTHSPRDGATRSAGLWADHRVGLTATPPSLRGLIPGRGLGLAQGGGGQTEPAAPCPPTPCSQGGGGPGSLAAVYSCCV